MFRQVVETDGFDKQEYSDTLGMMQGLASSVSWIGDKNWTATRGVEDLFSSLIKASPRNRDEGEMEPAFKINHRALASLRDDPGWKELRADTVGDNVLAGLTTQSLIGTMDEIYQRLSAAQEKADEMQDVAGLGHDSGDESGGTPGGDADAMAALGEQLAEELGEAGLTVDRIARQAIEKAVGEAKERQAVMTSWGLERGDILKLPVEERIKVADALKNQAVLDLAEVVGRMTNEAYASASHRFTQHPSEIHDVTVGNDLTHILPSEFALLAEPDIEIEFYRRFVTKRLMQYDLRGDEPVGRGPIVYLEDSSSSMNGPRTQFAKGLGIALMRVAKAQHRDFVVIVFSGAGSMKHFEGSDITNMLDYVSFGFSGGTEFTGPLTAALDLIESAMPHADIVLATDGQCSTTAGFLETFIERRDELGVKVHGVSIFSDAKSLEAYCNGTITSTNDLMATNKLGNLFSTVTN